MDTWYIQNAQLGRLAAILPSPQTRANARPLLRAFVYVCAHDPAQNMSDEVLYEMQEQNRQKLKQKQRFAHKGRPGKSFFLPRTMLQKWPP